MDVHRRSFGNSIKGINAVWHNRAVVDNVPSIQIEVVKLNLTVYERIGTGRGTRSGRFQAEGY